MDESAKVPRAVAATGRSFIALLARARVPSLNQEYYSSGKFSGKNILRWRFRAISVSCRCTRHRKRWRDHEIYRAVRIGRSLAESQARLAEEFQPVRRDYRHLLFLTKRGICLC